MLPSARRMISSIVEKQLCIFKGRPPRHTPRLFCISVGENTIACLLQTYWMECNQAANLDQ